MKTFVELSLSALLKTNLEKHGFTQATPIQEQAIEPALAGQDLVATAQTGSGKTLAFVLPLIQLLAKAPRATGIRAVVLSPTRELAIQTSETFEKMAAGSGISATVVVGGMGEGPQLRSIRKGSQVLIATPGRLQDFLGRRLVNLNGVRILVLDEADRMLDMGFLPTINKIMAVMPADRQTLFFSATIESSVKHLVEKHVPNGVRIEVGSATKPAEQVHLHFYVVEQDRKLGLLETMLRREEGSFLVFARTKRGADRLAKKLACQGVKTAAIHGDRSQNQRNQALRGFQDGYYRVLVATDIAARGIHVDGISHVVNYDLPQVPEDFIHRVGRTGRAGAQGTASTFGTRSERGEIARIERTLSIRLIRCNSREGGEQNPAEPVSAAVGSKQEHRRWRSFTPRTQRRRTPAASRSPSAAVSSAGVVSSRLASQLSESVADRITPIWCQVAGNA
jgi:ATP-dependent RNA helicase RhlE